MIIQVFSESRLENDEGKMRHEKGFTLVELLVAMVIGLVVMSAIYATYLSQIRSSEAMEEVSTVQQNLRVAMYRLERDIRMVGYDPVRKGDFGFTDTTQADTVSLTYDDDEDGILDANENITYQLAGTSLQRVVGGSTQTIAQNISGVTLFYNVDATFDVVTSVDISISGSWRGTSRELTTRISCRNMALGL